MEGTLFGLILYSMSAIGTFLIGGTALFGVIKFLKNISIKNEIMYGDEAEERYWQLKNKLNHHSYRVLKPIEYGGGDIKVPRFEIRKISSNSKTIGGDWNGKKAIIKYYEKDKNDENGKRIIIQRWLI